MAIKENYINIEEGQIGDLSNVNDHNSILLISDDRSNAYNMFERIIAGNDKFIKLK